jgi:hypothetical protein
MRSPRSRSGDRGYPILEFLSVRGLMLPALVIYGRLVDPTTGYGGLPCIWRMCFGFECPGCGLSRSNAFLVHGSLQEAVALNWLIVPVWWAVINSFVSEVFTLIRKRS